MLQANQFLQSAGTLMTPLASKEQFRGLFDAKSVGMTLVEFLFFNVRRLLAFDLIMRSFKPSFSTMSLTKTKRLKLCKRQVVVVFRASYVIAG